MKLLPTIVAVAFAENASEEKQTDLPKGIHASNCLFPNASWEDSKAVFADQFSRFTFSDSIVSQESYGDYYAEGTTLTRQCPVEDSCEVNADNSLACDFNGQLSTYPCEYNNMREMYAFMDPNSGAGKKNQNQSDKPRTLFFKSTHWNNFKNMSKKTECPGFGKRVFVPASADAQQSFCGAKPMVPNSKQEWAEEDKSIPSNPKECTIWNAEGTSTSCAVGCKPKTKKPRTLNLVCGQKKFGISKFQWWSREDGRVKPAGKRLLKAVYWCVPDPNYVPYESSGEGSGEGSGAQEIENADVSM